LSGTSIVIGRIVDQNTKPPRQIATKHQARTEAEGILSQESIRPRERGNSTTNKTSAEAAATPAITFNGTSVLDKGAWRSHQSR
jgi:hypothetical protein